MDDRSDDSAMIKRVDAHTLRTKLRQIARLSLVATLRERVRHGAVRFLIYQGAIVRVGRDAMTGPGRISIGKRWYGEPPRPSSFVVLHGGRARVSGAFAFHRGCDVRVTGTGALTLGDGYCADGVHIHCDHAISIGHGVAIARDVVIMDSDQHELDGGAAVGAVTIGSHVWIGAGAKILKGVTIGDGAVIAAGAIVTRDIAPGMLAAGAPARAIRTVTWQ